MEKIDQKEETSSVKKGWMVSPRLSFSHDIPQTELLPMSAEEANGMVESQEMDFDFSTSLEVSMQEPCSADELFSDGKIVPLSMRVSPVITATTTTTTVKGEKEVVDNLERKASLRTMIMDEDEHKKAAEWKPFWLFGRSGSVGSSGSTKPKTTSICPFRRSKSAGCNSRPIVSTTLKNKSKNSSSNNSNNNNNNNNNNNGMGLSRRGSMESNSKTYYYSGVKRWSHGDGVRISPVLNVPGAYLPRGGSTGSCRSNSSNSNSSSSIFGYLLCKCSNKGMEMEMEMREVACSP